MEELAKTLAEKVVNSIESYTTEEKVQILDTVAYELIIKKEIIMLDALEVGDEN